MKPILLATDGSPSAEAATAEALGLARSLEVPLVVACVAHETTPMYGGYYGFPEIAADMRKTQLEHVKDVLATVEQRAAEDGIPCTTLALEGPRGQVLCEAARDREARLIVVGAHGWDRIGRLIHGSVSTYVLHHAPCPVLVVHEDASADQSEVPAARRAEIVA
jgi:nucleotide-binding universal stress UspA family protein